MLFSLLLLSLLPPSLSLSADYVIVGAGTAGCALAARLCTYRPASTVLLLERAPPRDEETEFLVRSPRQMWNAWNSEKVVEFIETLPGRGINNRALRVYTGNTLGGSSAMNAMQWVLPINKTVESWGIQGLTTQSSREYYRRAFEKIGFKAQTGQLRHKYAGAYIRAATRAGFPRNDNPFDVRSGRDIFENRLAVDDKGRRVDSCTAYLTPVIDGACKRNLRLVQDATVTRILFKGKKATGVEYVKSSDKSLRNRKTASASREVLISAGPFGSPKLLQLSGIGGRNTLRDAGVTQRVSLPVGEYTQARPFVAIDSEYITPLEPSNNSTLLNSPSSRTKWETGGGGVLGISSFLANGRDRRDSYLTGTGSFFDANVDKKIISSSCNGNVRSRGFLRIRNANPFTTPLVQLSLFAKQWDFDATQRCLNRLREVHNSFPRIFGLQWLAPPGGVITEGYIRGNGGWAGHYVAGCAVGMVLDSELRVMGMRGLRVIDASALNRIPVSAGPMASTYMLAEYMAERIANAVKHESFNLSMRNR